MSLQDTPSVHHQDPTLINSLSHTSFLSNSQISASPQPAQKHESNQQQHSIQSRPIVCLRCWLFSVTQRVQGKAQSQCSTILKAISGMATTKMKSRSTTKCITVSSPSHYLEEAQPSFKNILQERFFEELQFNLANRELEDEEIYFNDAQVDEHNDQFKADSLRNSPIYRESNSAAKDPINLISIQVNSKTINNQEDDLNKLPVVTKQSNLKPKLNQWRSKDEQAKSKTKTTSVQVKKENDRTSNNLKLNYAHLSIHR